MVALSFHLPSGVPYWRSVWVNWATVLHNISQSMHVYHLLHFFVCNNNKTNQISSNYTGAWLLCCSYVLQIILVSSSHHDRDQSLFISTDEGATFQKQPITFYVETLIFHPKQEDKVLAYTKEGQVKKLQGGIWLSLILMFFETLHQNMYCLPYRNTAR